MRPAHRSAQTGLQAGGVAEEAGLRAGPDRGQAGAAPEAAGLVAGPGRALGRASIGTSRPAGRLRPGHAGACVDGDGGQRREREGERSVRRLE